MQLLTKQIASLKSSLVTALAALDSIGELPPGHIYEHARVTAALNSLTAELPVAFANEARIEENLLRRLVRKRRMTLGGDPLPMQVLLKAITDVSNHAQAGHQSLYAESQDELLGRMANGGWLHPKAEGAKEIEGQEPLNRIAIRANTLNRLRMRMGADDKVGKLLDRACKLAAKDRNAAAWQVFKQAELLFERTAGHHRKVEPESDEGLQHVRDCIDSMTPCPVDPLGSLERMTVVEHESLMLGPEIGRWLDPKIQAFFDQIQPNLKGRNLQIEAEVTIKVSPLKTQLAADEDFWTPAQPGQGSSNPAESRLRHGVYGYNTWLRALFEFGTVEDADQNQGPCREIATEISRDDARIEVEKILAEKAKRNAPAEEDPDAEPKDDCGCPACQLRRTMDQNIKDKAAGKEVNPLRTVGALLGLIGALRGVGAGKFASGGLVKPGDKVQ